MLVSAQTLKLLEFFNFTLDLENVSIHLLIDKVLLRPERRGLIAHSITELCSALTLWGH